MVGNEPLLFAPKAAALSVDNGTTGIVDPGDVLHYTITIYNHGAVPATGVVLTDSVPANTTYVAGLHDAERRCRCRRSRDARRPIAARSHAGVADPATIDAGRRARCVEFDLQVNAGVPAGTLISNQATVGTNELPDLLTDGDGNPATGPEPTVVVVGDAQQLTITKQVVGGGRRARARGLDARVHRARDATSRRCRPPTVVITDDLDMATPGRLTYVAGSAVLNGSATGVTVVGIADHGRLLRRATARSRRARPRCCASAR